LPIGPLGVFSTYVPEPWLCQLFEEVEEAVAVTSIWGYTAHHSNLASMKKGNGHYTASVLIGDDWYNADDSSVKKGGLKHLLKRKAYVLMYRKR
jgi:ubiquitin C-terminal hydrolase